MSDDMIKLRALRSRKGHLTEVKSFVETEIKTSSGVISANEGLSMALEDMSSPVKKLIAYVMNDPDGGKRHQVFIYGDDKRDIRLLVMSLLKATEDDSFTITFVSTDNSYYGSGVALANALMMTKAKTTTVMCECDNLTYFNAWTYGQEKKVISTAFVELKTIQVTVIADNTAGEYFESTKQQSEEIARRLTTMGYLTEDEVDAIINRREAVYLDNDRLLNPGQFVSKTTIATTLDATLVDDTDVSVDEEGDSPISIP